MSDSPQIEMPLYQSHKQVWALKIETIIFNKGDGTAMIIPADHRYAPFDVDAEYVTKHQPKNGGYYVVYKDGYKSWSPAEAFEDGYSAADTVLDLGDLCVQIGHASKERLLAAWRAYSDNPQAMHPCEHFKAGWVARALTVNGQTASADNIKEICRHL